MIWSTNSDVFTKEKFLELKQRLSDADTKPDIIAISETKPKNFEVEIPPSAYAIPGYDCELRNVSKNSAGRGLLLYVNSSLDFTSVDLESVFKTDVLETLCVIVKLRNGDQLCFNLFYRSPNSSSENNEKMNFYINKLSEGGYSYLILTGDFNYPFIDWNKNSCTTGETSESFKFLEAVRDSFLHQHVSEPTRGRGTDTPSCIDLVFTNEPDTIEPVTLQAPLGKSDHALLVITVNCKKQTHSGQAKPNYKRGNYDRLRQQLDIDWDSVMAPLENNVEDLWQSLKSRIEEAVERCVPMTKPGHRLGDGRIPLDKKTRTKINRKNRLWKSYVASRDPKIYEEYCQTRNQVRRLTRKATKEYEKHLAKDVKHNPKKFWKYVSNNTKVKCGIPNLSKDGTEKGQNLTENDSEKAEILADFFSSVFTREPEEVEVTTEPAVTHFKLDTFFTETDVLKLLKDIKTGKSPGPDKIHPRVLYEARDMLYKPLTKIFQTSLETKTLPEDWKKANITAIHKKGSKVVAGNYRPVSLTSVVCKLLETLIRNHLLKHLKSNNLLSNKQFGFISGRSTVLQLIQVLEKWTEILDKGGCIDVIYCDFMKAFDKVPHRRLIQTLNNYGITDPLLGWVEQFLLGRKQCVTVNGASSTWQDVLSGIPQGTVLGPILFVAYINSLPEVVSNSDIYLFADDTKIFKGIFTSEDCNDLQDDLDAMHKWTDTSLLKFHPDKCVSMRIGNSQVEDRQYNMDKHSLKKSEVEKDIGVFIDEKLSFGTHVENKVNKANSMMGIIRRTFEYLDESSFLLLYKALVRPHLEYANQVWAPTLKKQEIEIENVQRRATKLIPGYKDLTYEERLRKLNLPTLKYRRTRGDMIEMYKIITGKYDPDVSNFITLNNSNYETRGHQYKLEKEGARLNIRKRCFTHRTTDLWNSLPPHVVSAKTVINFEIKLDRHWENQDFKFDPEADKPSQRENRQEELPPEEKSFQAEEDLC